MFSSSKDSVKASVVDSALVVSFKSGKEPRVWRIDMGKFLSSALEIRESQGKFLLTMKPGNGQAEEIGVFADRKKAIDALNAVTEALLRGKDFPPPVKSGGWFKSLMKFILLLLMIGVLLTMWSKPFPMNGTDKPSTVKTGVPVPADDLFGK